MGQDEDRSFAGYAPCVPIEVFVQDKITPDGDPLAGEAVDQLEIAFLFIMHGTMPQFLSEIRGKSNRGQMSRKGLAHSVSLARHRSATEALGNLGRVVGLWGLRIYKN